MLYVRACRTTLRTRIVSQIIRVSSVYTSHVFCPDDKACHQVYIVVATHVLSFLPHESPDIERQRHCREIRPFDDIVLDAATC